jgi:hypothetical protein
MLIVYNIHIMNIHNYRNLTSIVLFFIMIYTLYILYNIRFRLRRIISTRIGNNEFKIALIMFVALFIIYGVGKKILYDIDVDDLDGPERETYDDMRKKIDVFKHALLNGLIAILISILAIADTFMPGFFVTVVIYYYKTISL